jgi:integrase
MPVHPELVQLLEALWSRPRRPGVETLLVNSSGSPWTGDGFGGSFNRIRDAAQIYHIDENTGARKRKHLHDIRGTFATEVITGSDLSDTKIAGLMGWSPERVRTIRRVYVDEAKVAVALDERIAGAFVKYAVKRSNDLN